MPEPKCVWRSWEHMPGEDLVEMPRSLALDLVKLLDVSCFWEEQEKAGEHDPDQCQILFDAHRERMEKIGQTISIHLGSVFKFGAM